MIVKSIIIARLLFAGFAFTCCANSQSPDQLYGRWKVTAVAGASPITAMSGAAADRLVGHLLVLTPHSLRFAKETCHPTYEVSQETSSQFPDDYKIDGKTLKLPDPAIRFSADCTDLFIRAPSEIVFYWDGFFLEAKKLPAKKVK